MEETEEKQTSTSAQIKLNWISEFFQNPLKFSSAWFKIGSVLDKTPINKVVALSLEYKVAFDQNLSSVQNSSEKSSGKSAKTEILTESVGQFVNSNFRSIFIKIRAVLYQTPNRKV